MPRRESRFDMLRVSTSRELWREEPTALSPQQVREIYAAVWCALRDIEQCHAERRRDRFGRIVRP